MNLLDFEKLLRYNPSTGLFYWLESRSNILKGSVAGTPCRGHVAIKVNDKKYAAHRLAWLFMYKQWPDLCIDHVNGDRSDNRISNLRLATHSQNRMNANTISFGTYQTAYKTWGAKIGVNGKRFHLGTFKTKDEAVKAYQIASNTLFKEFSVFNRNTINHKEFQMSRASSVVLTPAEKKAVVANLKAELKVAQGNVKLLASEAKTVAKARAAEDKVQAGLVKTAESALAKAQKALDAATA